MHVNTLVHNQELDVYKRITATVVEHTGQQFVRQLEGSFKLDGPYGRHDVFVLTPLGMSLRTLQEMQESNVFQQVSL